jgi:anti-sigma regulatory factor (Ser/Thr protein kinase)
MEVGEQLAAQTCFEISDSSHAGQVRRAAARAGERLGMSESECSNIGIAATEVASNILKHAERGKVLLEAVGDDGTRGLRILAIDKGPGIRNISAALEDGHSTAGTGGNGLGAIRRLATVFDIYAPHDKGTCVLAEFWPHRKAPKHLALQIGVVSVPIRGESVCGDGWASKTLAGWVLLMMADGLGHGIYAAEAAREAEKILHETRSKSPAVILQDSHDALRKTRGAALAIAAIDCEVGKLLFAGLGNISSSLLDNRHSRGMASHNGTAGHDIRKIQEFSFPWNGHSILIMHSDGLTGRWNLADYPGLQNKPPSMIAAVLYRDFSRERDDATVLVAKSH